MGTHFGTELIVAAADGLHERAITPAVRIISKSAYRAQPEENRYVAQTVREQCRPW
jgi:hypothetical protein